MTGCGSQGRLSAKEPSGSTCGNRIPPAYRPEPGPHHVAPLTKGRGPARDPRPSHLSIARLTPPGHILAGHLPRWDSECAVHPWRVLPLVCPLSTSCHSFKICFSCCLLPETAPGLQCRNILLLLLEASFPEAFREAMAQLPCLSLRCASPDL